MAINGRSARSTESYLTPPISRGSHPTRPFELGYYNTDVSALNSIVATSHARPDRIPLPEFKASTPPTSHTARSHGQLRLSTHSDLYTSPLSEAAAGDRRTNGHHTHCFTARGAHPADAIIGTNQLVGGGFGRLKNLQRLSRQWIAADYHAPLGIFWDERDMSMFLEALQGRFRDVRRSNESRTRASDSDPFAERFGEPRYEGGDTTPVDKPPDSYFSGHRSRHRIAEFGTGNKVGLDDERENFVFEIQPPGQGNTVENLDYLLISGNIAKPGVASPPESQEGTTQSHEGKSTNQSHGFVATRNGQGDGGCFGELYGLGHDNLQNRKLRPFGTMVSPNIGESKKNRFDPRAPHFDAVIVDLPNVRPADIPNGMHVTGSAWRSRPDLHKLPMESLAGRPGWVFLCVGPTEGLADGKKLLGVWGFKKVEVVALLRNNTGWGSQHAGDWDELSCKAGGWDGQSVFGGTVEWVLVGIKGAVKRTFDGHIIHCNMNTEVMVISDCVSRSALLATLMENFSLGRRRLYMFGGPDELRPGWVTIGRRIRKTNFHCRDFIKKWGNTPGSKNSWLMPQDDEIEYSRPKTPPAKVRANLRDAGAQGGGRSTNQGDIKMAALGDQRSTATFPHPGQRRAPMLVEVDIRFVLGLQEIRPTPACPHNRVDYSVSSGVPQRLPYRKCGGGRPNPVVPPFASFISEKQVDYHAQTPGHQYHCLEGRRGIGKHANINGKNTPPGSQRTPNRFLAHAGGQSIAAPQPIRPMRHLSLDEPAPWGSVRHLESHNREPQFQQGITKGKWAAVVSDAATITRSPESMCQMLEEGESTITTYSPKHTLGALSRPPPNLPHHDTELGRGSAYQCRYSGTGLSQAHAPIAHSPEDGKDIEYPNASHSTRKNGHLVHVSARHWRAPDMFGPGIDLIPDARAGPVKSHNYWHLPPTLIVSADGDMPGFHSGVHKNPQSISDTPLQYNNEHAVLAAGSNKNVGRYQKQGQIVPGDNPRFNNNGSTDSAANQPPYEWKNHRGSPSHSAPWRRGISRGRVQGYCFSPYDREADWGSHSGPNTHEDPYVAQATQGYNN